MTAFRQTIPDFQLGNPLYAAARVTFYEADEDGEATATLATLYANPTGSVTAANPQTLDADGKFAAPVYIVDPVIASVVGPNIASHTTGAIGVRGTYKGDWVTATRYFVNDTVKDPDEPYALYVASQDFTSSADFQDDVDDELLVIVTKGAPETDQNIFLRYDQSQTLSVPQKVQGNTNLGSAAVANNLSDLAAKYTALDNISIHGADKASASTVNLETATGDLVDITGTTTITAITLSEGHERVVRFTGALTFTHGSSLVLPGAQNITTAAGDFAILRGYAAGVVRCVTYIRADGHPLIAGQATIASASTTDLGSKREQSITVSGVVTITSFGSSAPIGAVKFITFSGILVLTYNASSLILPTGGSITTAVGDSCLAKHETSGNWRVLYYSKADGTPLLSALLPYGRMCIPVPAGAMTPNTTNGATLTKLEMTTNLNMFVTLDYDPTTAQSAQFCIAMPDSWNEGTITFAPVWSHPAAAAFGVVWELAAVALSDDDAGDVAFGTGQKSTDTGGTTNDIYIGPESSAITIAGTPQAGDFVFFRVKRLPADASDTMAVNARLHGIKLFITTDSGHD